MSQKKHYYVAYYHSPLTREIVKAWFNKHEIAKSRRVLLTDWRVENNDGFDCDICLKLPGTKNKKLRTFYGIFRSPIFWYQFKRHVKGNFTLITPHLLSLPIRFGVMQNHCLSVEIIEDGLLSFKDYKDSIRRNSLIHRFLNLFGLPDSKIKKFWASHPRAFLNAPVRDRLPLPTQDKVGDYGACILVDIIRKNLGYGEKQEAIYFRWAKRLIEEKEIRSVVLKMHPSFQQRDIERKNIIKKWHEVLPECDVAVCEQSLDFVSGGGTLMLGIYSSLLVYADGNGWECLIPDELVDQIPLARMINDILDHKE